MKTAIVYASTHHGNTKKLVDAIAAEYAVDLIDANACETAELSGYDRIGIASGVAFGKYYPRMLAFMEENLPADKPVFYIHTAGDPRENHCAAAKTIAAARNCAYLGAYYCKGFDTYGPFKLVGGIAKGHPNADEIAGAVRFYAGLRGSEA